LEFFRGFGLDVIDQYGSKWQMRDPKKNDMKYVTFEDKTDFMIADSLWNSLL
jgi:hypothetical protein